MIRMSCKSLSDEASQHLAEFVELNLNFVEETHFSIDHR